MHYPNIDPGPAAGHSAPEPETINIRLRGGVVKVCYTVELIVDLFGQWLEPVISWVEWAFCPGHDVHDLTDLERDELTEEIREMI